jgi:hypothetical protein
MSMSYVRVAELAQQFGAENLRFFFPAFRRDPDLGMVVIDKDAERTVVEARAVERDGRMVNRGYRFIAEPLDQSFAREDFYHGDFESLASAMPDSYFIMVDEVRYSVGHQRSGRAA